MFGAFYRGIPTKQFDEYTHNNESVILIAGWRLKQYTFNVSADMITSKLVGVRPWSAYELNVSYTFPEHPTTKPLKVLPCPHFHDDI